MRVPRRCSTPWRRSALPPTSSLAHTLYWPHCLRHTLNVSNAYPLPAPSSHWGFHVADAARRGVTMCSALPPPTSSLACTFVSHFIILLPAPSTSTVESPCPLSAPHPSISQMLTPSHAVESPCVLPYHLPRLLPAPYTGAMSPHIATSTSTPSTLPRPRLQPLNIHMGVPRSRCSTPWNHHALCLPHTL